MPVHNFSPELIKIFQLGNSDEGFKFDCKSNDKAHALRWRLHCLRREMRKENHPLLKEVEPVILSIYPSTKTGTFLFAHLPDDTIVNDLREAFAKRGVTQEEIEALKKINEKAEAETEEADIEKETEKGTKENDDVLSTLGDTNKPDDDASRNPRIGRLSANAIDNYLKKKHHGES